MNDLGPDAHWIIPAVIAVTAALFVGVWVVLTRRLRRRMQMDRNQTSVATPSERRLRFMEGEQRATNQQREQEALAQARGKTVLVADDDPGLSRSLAIRLESLGLKVIRSSDAVNALLGAHRALPDLAILDVKMPSGNGLAVCEMMAANPECSRIPVIIYTGVSDAQTIARCKRLGAHYVQKSPDAWAQLKSVIEELFRCETEEEDLPAIAAPSLSDDDEKPVPSSDASDGVPHTETGERTDLKVLHIDDNLEIRDALARQLKNQGIRVLGASDAESAYLMCYAEKPGAILLDANVRGGKYREALTHLRAHPFLAGVPIVILGKPADGEGAREAATLKGLRFIAKPIDMKALVRELHSHASFGGTAPPHAPKRDPKPALGATTGAGALAPPAPEAGPVAIVAAEGVAESEGEQEEATDPSDNRTRPRVLVIDDDPAVSRSIAIRLRPLGVDVFHAFNGMQGYWTGLDVAPDVIISDLKMPEGEGNYILSRFRSHPLTKSVPMIILTGETNPAVKRTMLSLGVVAYFTKPWSFDELLEELGRHINLHSAPADHVHLPAG